MPVQLYALTWSQDDTQAIQDWQAQNVDRVYVAGWSRILLEPLDKAVSDPNIFGLAIDGVVIANHEKWPADALKEALRKLTAGTLKLYSVTHGLEPLSPAEPAKF